MTTVVSLRGDIPPGDVYEDAIDMLERYLGWARAGEITSVAIAVVKDGHSRIGTEWASAPGDTFMLTAAVTTLHARIGIAMAEAE
jgi:hypothetical protein